MTFLITLIVLLSVIGISYAIYSGIRGKGSLPNFYNNSSNNKEFAESYEFQNIDSLITNIDKKKIKEIKKRSNTLWDLIRKIISYKDKVESNIPIRCAETKRYLRKRVADSLPIEKINRNGSRIPIQPLKYKRILTIGELIDSGNDYEHFYGIGEASIKNIRKNLNEIKREISQNTKLVLSLDDRNNYASELVKKVSIYFSLEPIIFKCKEALEEKKELDLIVNNLKQDFKQFIAQQADTSAKFNENLRKLSEFFDSFEKEIFIPFKSIIERSSDEAWDDFSKDPIKFITLIEKYSGDAYISDKGEYGLTSDIAKKLKATTLSLNGLNCSLRPYQEWGTKYIVRQQRTILGDEMGLGKTVQAIAAMVNFRNSGDSYFMVVCPLSVLTNWCREIARFSDLKYSRIYGDFREKYFKMWLQNGGVAVTTYETLSALKLNEIEKIDFLVVDEAHLIKNPCTNRSNKTQFVINCADKITFLTGTVLENKVEEMIQLIDFLTPRVSSDLRSMSSLRELDAFKEKVAQVYFRRKRIDVLSELPEKTEIDDWCDLNEVETKEYERLVLEHNYAAARRVSWNVPPNNSTKLEKLKYIVNEAKNDGRKVLVFSYFLDTIDVIVKEFKNSVFGPITGKINSEKRQDIIDKFNNAPAGSILVSQIVAGGVGLNIQAASVVVICEPQFKPSIENQAISRSYRMGQPRKVIVYHLLAAETLEDKIVEILALKQKEFNDFADSSMVAEESFQIDTSMFTGIMKNELERIKMKTGAKEVALEPKSEIKEVTSRVRRGVSVTTRIKQIKQPFGGYLNPNKFEEIIMNDGNIINDPNINPGIVGMTVDYLTRFMGGEKKENAFSISLKGAQIVNQLDKAKSLLEEINGLDDKSIINATKLVGYDSAYRAGPSRFVSIESLRVPNSETISNIKIMVQRSLAFFKEYGPVTKQNFTFEGGYTDIIASGDGDFLTEDTLWDFKVSKKSITNEHTLQILIYYLMGIHSGKPEFKNIKFIGIYNPRLNVIYRFAVSSIDDNVIKEVEKDVIGY